MFPDVPVLGLTATATSKVTVDVQKMLGIQGSIVFKATFNRPNLYYEVGTAVLPSDDTTIMQGTDIKYLQTHPTRTYLQKESSNLWIGWSLYFTWRSSAKTLYHLIRDHCQSAEDAAINNDKSHDQVPIIRTSWTKVVWLMKNWNNPKYCYL